MNVEIKARFTVIGIDIYLIVFVGYYVEFAENKIKTRNIAEDDKIIAVIIKYMRSKGKIIY